MVKLTGFSSVATATQDAAVEEEEETYYFTLVAEDGPSNTSAAQSAVSDAAPAKKVQLESEGLLRWKAPETVVYGKSTTKSDVWCVCTCKDVHCTAYTYMYCILKDS